MNLQAYLLAGRAFAMKTSSAIVCAALLAAQPAGAASFDCARAVSRTENAICASGELSRLDVELDTAYRAAMERSAEPQTVRASQRAWLEDTRNTCGDQACLARVYRERTAALLVAPASRLPSSRTPSSQLAPPAAAQPGSNPEQAFFDRAARITLTPLLADLAGLSFGDGPARLPRDFELVPKSAADRQKAHQLERESGFPVCDVYRSHAARTAMPGLSTSAVAYCFDGGRLLNVVALFPGTASYHRLVSRVASLVGNSGERDRIADEARIWQRTINGLPIEIVVSRLSDNVAYTEQLEHSHTQDTVVRAPRRESTSVPAKVVGADPALAPVQELTRALTTVDRRCPQPVVQASLESLAKIRELTRYGQTAPANHLARQQLVILRSTGCIGR